MAHAVNTTVPVERSVAEILAMLKKAGALRIAQAETEDGFERLDAALDRLAHATQDKVSRSVLASRSFISSDI